jgi:hypothetical protein
MPNSDAQSSSQDSPGESGHEKTPDSGAFIEAAEGTRTLDLLHGKQTL